MTGRLVLLATTHRVAPGLLSWPAWQLLTRAEVYAASVDHPMAEALAAADVLLRVPEASTLAGRMSYLLQRSRTAEVVWLSGPDGDEGLAEQLSGQLAGWPPEDPVPEIELLPASWDLPGARLLDLVAVMDRLRSPGGCPWDARQTHLSLLPYLLEEAYETVEVIETGDLVGLREELGDLLLQVVFHARIGEEHADHPWSVDDVAAGIVDKLVLRHPHVFDDAASGQDGQAGQPVTAEQVEVSWEELKRVEKGRGSAVDGVPMAQPALALAAKLIERSSRAGLVVQVPAAAADDFGGLLLEVVAKAAAAGVDPEAELRAAARRYAERIRAAEQG